MDSLNSLVLYFLGSASADRAEPHFVLREVTVETLSTASVSLDLDRVY